MPDTINDATAYDVSVSQAAIAPGTLYWKVVRVHHLTPTENNGKHHIFLDAIDEDGARVFATRLRVSWAGGQEDIVIDKPLSEPGANCPMWKWQVCSVGVLGLPSDRVENLRTDHADEAPGNTFFHHSFAVTFQRTLSPSVLPSTDKALASYVLFPPAGRADTRLYLLLAADILATKGLAFGFSSADAAHAARVLLVGNHPSATRKDIEEAGCLVEALPTDPAALLAALKQRSG